MRLFGGSISIEQHFQLMARSDRAGQANYLVQKRLKASLGCQSPLHSYCSRFIPVYETPQHVAMAGCSQSAPNLMQKYLLRA